MATELLYACGSKMYAVIIALNCGHQIMVVTCAVCRCQWNTIKNRKANNDKGQELQQEPGPQVDGSIVHCEHFGQQRPQLIRACLPQRAAGAQMRRHAEKQNHKHSIHAAMRMAQLIWRDTLKASILIRAMNSIAETCEDELFGQQRP